MNTSSVNSCFLDQALCAGSDTNDWVSSAPGNTQRVRARKAICATCPVTARCLDSALAKPEWSLGIWAGTSVNERAGIARAMRAVIASGKDIRDDVIWDRFNADAGLTRDVETAVEAPEQLAGLLGSRHKLSVVAAAALLARHDEGIATRIAARCDQPEWLLRAAARIGASSYRVARRRANASRMRKARGRVAA
ncbi:MAG: WhiB family transcriptional regulator [Acidimicrobiales bacterium]